MRNFALRAVSFMIISMPRIAPERKSLQHRARNKPQKSMISNLNLKPPILRTSRAHDGGQIGRTKAALHDHSPQQRQIAGKAERQRAAEIKRQEMSDKRA